MGDFNGIMYLCPVADIREETIAGFLEDVLGISKSDENYGIYLQTLNEGSSAFIPVDWAKGAIDFKVHNGGIQIGSHASSERIVLFEKLHPAIMNYLENEGLKPSDILCAPTLECIVNNHDKAFNLDGC